MIISDKLLNDHIFALNIPQIILVHAFERETVIWVSSHECECFHVFVSVRVVQWHTTTHGMIDFVFFFFSSPPYLLMFLQLPVYVCLCFGFMLESLASDSTMIMTRRQPFSKLSELFRIRLCISFFSINTAFHFRCAVCVYWSTSVQSKVIAVILSVVF